MAGGQFRIVPYQPDRVLEIVDLLANCLTADPITRALFVRKVLLDPNFGPAGAPVALLEGQAVGFGLSIARSYPIEDGPIYPEHGYITLLAVRPDGRRTGIASALVGHMERYLRSRGCNASLVSPYSPNYFTPGVDVAAYADALATFGKLGYSEVYRPVAMDTNLLTLRTPDRVLARDATLREEGVIVETCRIEWIAALMEFLRADFPGDWQRFAREALHRVAQGEPATRLWIAHNADEVLAFSHHEGERFGPIGVSAKYRGRGIGQTLLYRTLDSMRTQGLHAAWFMWSDDRTAELLYRQAGFVVTRRFAVLKKAL